MFDRNPIVLVASLLTPIHGMYKVETSYGIKDDSGSQVN
jgi:hypothetical protein